MKDSFKLTKEQRQILERIGAEMENFRQAGGKFVWDCELNEPSALNTLCFDDVMIVYDDNPKGYVEVEMSDVLDYEIPISFDYLGCEDVIMVKPKYNKNMF